MSHDPGRDRGLLLPRFVSNSETFMANALVVLTTLN